MKISFTKKELSEFIKKAFPAELIPEGYEVDNVQTEGYPVRDFVVTFEPKEEVVEEVEKP